MEREITEWSEFEESPELNQSSMPISLKPCVQMEKILHRRGQLQEIEDEW